jgi:hypothetical protein
LRLKRNSQIPASVAIPGEDVELPLKIKALGVEEAIELRSKYREAENAKEEEKAKYWAPLLVDSFRDYVRIDCDLTIERDGVEVKIDSAEKLIPFFGGDVLFLNAIFFSILNQNSLSAAKKKTLRSAIASKLSSDEQNPEAPGPKLETTATSAEPGDSARSEDAPDLLESSPSGSTDGEKTDPASSSTNAPFVA